MTQNEWGETQAGAGSTSNASGEFVRQERRAAEGLVDDAKTAATEAGSKARDFAAEKAGELQGEAASHLKNFAEAIRTAGDELADKEPGPVSDLVRQAAEGLEQFSGALGRKSTSEMIDSVRDFGRHNPVGFLAGSMLAGFALARFASSGSGASGSGAQGRSGSYEPAYPTRPSYPTQTQPADTFGAGSTGGVGEESLHPISAESEARSGTDLSPDAGIGGESFKKAADVGPSGDDRPRDSSQRGTQA